jgi:hypothetical protein
MKTIESIQRELKELDLQLANVSKRSAAHKPLIERHMTLSRDYASLLIEIGVPQLSEYDYDPPDYCADEAPNTYPYWSVHGVPSKQGRILAEEWMRERGLQWNGDAPSLRREVIAALRRGATVPHFGLSIRLTTVVFK